HRSYWATLLTST
ncbi:acrB/AcrD/AcrF family protein, partial [Vibrio parahaemolyticus V-223/04]